MTRDEEICLITDALFQRITRRALKYCLIDDTLFQDLEELVHLLRELKSIRGIS